MSDELTPADAAAKYAQDPEVAPPAPEVEGRHPADAPEAEVDETPRQTIDASVLHGSGNVSASVPSGAGEGSYFSVSAAPQGAWTGPEPSQTAMAPLPPPPATLHAVGGTQGVDVELDLDELNTFKVKLGGKVWHAVEPTIGVSKKLAEALPTIQAAEDMDEDEEDDDISNRAVLALQSIIPQVQEVLRSVDDGQPPTAEWIETYLTGRNFARLMERLNAEGTKKGDPQNRRARRRR